MTGATYEGDFPSFSEGLSLRPGEHLARVRTDREFPFLFGRAFIEARADPDASETTDNFPSFSEGLSLRLPCYMPSSSQVFNFPSFSEGLSLRLLAMYETANGGEDFPSFSEGLSLRPSKSGCFTAKSTDFPSFSEGLSLRLARFCVGVLGVRISLPFRKGFH